MIKKMLIIIIFMSIFGCSKTQHFTVRIWNETDEKLSDVKIWNNDKLAYDVGVFIPGGKHTYDFMYTPLDGNIKLTWTEFYADIERIVVVDMDGIIPEKYDNAVIHFTIKGPTEVVVGFYHNTNL